MRIGVIGNGKAAQSLVQLLPCDLIEEIAIYASDPSPILEQKTNVPVRAVASLTDLIEEKVEIVAECAEHTLRPQQFTEILDSGCDLIVTSIATLADPKLFRRFQKACYHGQASWITPREAESGMDMLEKLSSQPGLSVLYSLKRSAVEWSNAKVITTKNSIQEPFETVFEGSAKDAASTFPQSSDILSALALAGPGFDNVSVRFIANNSIEADIHKYQICSPVCRVAFEAESSRTASGGECASSIAHKIIHLLRKQSV